MQEFFAKGWYVLGEEVKAFENKNLHCLLVCSTAWV
jgi:hypothetical protein